MSTKKRQPRPKSLVLVNTGDGKGKTTAAMGVAVRGVARNWNVGVVQFIKSGDWRSGEARIAKQLGISWWNIGDGFTWESTDLEETARLGRAAWELAAELIAGGQHDLLILDEITYAMTYQWISVEEVVHAIKHRPAAVSIVITGRDAPEELIAVADTVTEMRNVKHAHDAGVKAMKGIDF